LLSLRVIRVYKFKVRKSLKYPYNSKSITLLVEKKEKQ
ncbi:hypothetical protein FPSE_07663, partial [Fusarium pseudograminearum CS3096]